MARKRRKPAGGSAPSAAERREITPGEVCLAYQEVFATDAGHVVLADLMRRFGYTRTSTLVEGSPDRTALNEGQRTVLVHIGRQLDLDPKEADEAAAQEFDPKEEQL